MIFIDCLWAHGNSAHCGDVAHPYGDKAAVAVQVRKVQDGFCVVFCCFLARCARASKNARSTHSDSAWQ